MARRFPLDFRVARARRHLGAVTALTSQSLRVPGVDGRNRCFLQSVPENQTNLQIDSYDS